MSRNEMFVLLACAIMVSVISSGPSPLARSSSVTLASLIAPVSTEKASGDPALFQQSFDQQ